MTDHEGMIASLNPKLTKDIEPDFSQADRELLQLIEETNRNIRIAMIAVPILLLITIAVVFFGPEIDAWRWAL